MFYDPLGIISPLSLQTRLLFKNICNEKLDWDDIILEKFAKEWSNLLNSLGDIKHINIDRYVSTTSNPGNVLELHGFCDASKVAFCTAIYIRVISNSIVVASALTAKCRLVPNKDYAIPRLQFLACLLFSSHMNTVLYQSKSRYTQFMAELTLNFPSG